MSEDFVLLTVSENIRSPAKPGDVGYNLVCSEGRYLAHGCTRMVPTGVKVKIPPGHWGLITARSSAVSKHKILVFPGVIDEGYVGELFVACMAVGGGVSILKGQSIAQLILIPACIPPLKLVDVLPETTRGETGFGSSGA